MNNGLFGFPTGGKVTVDIQEFDVSGTWYKPANAKFCIIEGTGAGQGGQNGNNADSGGDSGAAGVAYQIVAIASKFNLQETVTIGTGSAGVTGTPAQGGQSIFADINFPGGYGINSNRNAFTGNVTSGAFGSGAGTNGVSGRHGSFGAGGGGTGGISTAIDGSAGGKPRSFAFEAGTNTAATGGGAAGGTSVSAPGKDADPANDRFGFGEGGGGGAHITGGTGGRGGNGRRGGGGGGGGGGTTGGTGGTGGNGFIRVYTYCWE